MRGRDANVYDRYIPRKYALDAEEVLNIFIMPHHPDSLAKSTYEPKGQGVALGKSIKVTGIYERQHDAWRYRGLLNHELGHVLGLSHTWNSHDGCDDTPKNPNCWNIDPNRPGCETTFSNNLMDYNALQIAWTPCQIGRARYRLGYPNSRQRQLLKKTWCQRQPEKDLIIRDTITWDCMKDLEGQLTIATGASLTIQCHIAIPAQTKIIVEPGGELNLDNCTLYNDCNLEWGGIELQSNKTQNGIVNFIGDVNLKDYLGT